jgi:type IV secretory pathway VirB3-like protein
MVKLTKISHVLARQHVAKGFRPASRVIGVPALVATLSPRFAMVLTMTVTVSSIMGPLVLVVFHTVVPKADAVPSAGMVSVQVASNVSTTFV